MLSATHPNARLIETFYAAFQRRDRDAMIACYAPDIRFSDPVFQDLQGPRVAAMWRMLGERSAGGEITFCDVAANDTTGRAHWEARYVFFGTGRRVHNVIDASFEIRGGKIARHTDQFDLWRWAGMALGLRGRLLGWSSPVQRAIRRTALRSLAEFESAARPRA